MTLAVIATFTNLEIWMCGTKKQSEVKNEITAIFMSKKILHILEIVFSG